MVGNKFIIYHFKKKGLDTEGGIFSNNDPSVSLTLNNNFQH